MCKADRQQSEEEPVALPSMERAIDHTHPKSTKEDDAVHDEDDVIQGEDVPVVDMRSAIMSVISGVSRMESVAHVIVDGAVRQVLEEVAASYGTTVEALMRAHGDRAVSMWTRVAPPCQPRRRPAEALCTATTRKKKPCSKPARVGTLCSWHAAMAQALQNDENAAPHQHARQERVVAFQASLREMPPPPPPRMSQSVWSFSQEPSQQ